MQSLPIFYYVYIITNKLSNKKYVGSRMCYENKIELDNYMGSSKYLNADYKKYGIENFCKEIIDLSYKNKDEMLNGETFYILKFNTLEPYGYNRFLPNDKIGFHTGGLEVSEKTRKKLSISLKGKKRKKLSIEHCKKLHDSMLGKNKDKTFSEEIKQKMRKPKTEVTKIKMRKPKSEDTKIKMRKPKTLEHRQNLINSHLGKKRGKYKKAVKILTAFYL